MRGRKSAPKRPPLILSIKLDTGNTRYSIVSELCEKLIKIVIDSSEDCFQYRISMLNDLIDSWLKENTESELESKVNEMESKINCDDIDSKSFQCTVLGSGTVVDKAADDSSTDVDESYQVLSIDSKPLPNSTEQTLSSEANNVEIKQELVESTASKPVKKRKKKNLVKKKQSIAYINAPDNEKSLTAEKTSVSVKNCTSKRHSKSKLKKAAEGGIELKEEGDVPTTFFCEHCGDLLPSKKALLVHSERHVGPASKPCPDCGKVFTRLPYLKRHMACVHGHMGKRIPCTICSKVFTRTDHLQLHMRFHTGERPYLCITCGKGFYSSQDLRKHSQRVHIGLKKFVCDICEKGYTNKESLVKHKETLHPNTLCETPLNKPLLISSAQVTNKSLATQQQ